jgi:hypothetical protein
MIATEAHGKTRKNKCHKILFSVSFRVLPWLLDKSGAQLNIRHHQVERALAGSLQTDFLAA